MSKWICGKCGHSLEEIFLCRENGCPREDAYWDELRKAEPSFAIVGQFGPELITTPRGTDCSPTPH